MKANRKGRKIKIECNIGSSTDKPLVVPKPVKPKKSKKIKKVEIQNKRNKFNN